MTMWEEPIVMRPRMPDCELCGLPFDSHESCGCLYLLPAEWSEWIRPARTT